MSKNKVYINCDGVHIKSGDDEVTIGTNLISDAISTGLLAGLLQLVVLSGYLLTIVYLIVKCPVFGSINVIFHLLFLIHS